MSVDENGRGDRRAAPSRALWRMTAWLALGALASALLLAGLSAWFLGAVALAGAGSAAFAFNYHMPAALVRLFAMSRTAAKYGERLVGHKAALVDQTARRGTLFAAMAAAPKVRSAGWQLQDQDRLSDFIDDVEDVDFARLRLHLPVLGILAALGALVTATLALAPLALLAPASILVSVALLTRSRFPASSLRWQSVRRLRRKAGRALGTALASVVPLKAEGAWAPQLAGAFRALSLADSQAGRLRGTLSRFDAVWALLGPASALAVLAASWQSGHSGQALLVPAFLSFGWLAFGEATQPLGRIALAELKRKAAKSEISAWTRNGAPTATMHDRTPRRFGTWRLSELPRRAPDGRILGGTISLELRAGKPTVLAGASGSGKTSLLKQIAGWLDGDDAACVRGDGDALSARQRRTACHLGLHDAAVICDTVRANLFAPEASDNQCEAALAAVELTTRIQAAGGLDGWIAQETLSLGEAQRLNLARALLSRKPVILLDEPGEHLDSDQAARIMARLVAALDDRVLVFSSHHDGIAGQGVARVRLDRPGEGGAG